jgi:hypothetical protein
MKIRQAPQFGAHIQINIKTYPENPSNDKQAAQVALHVLELRHSEGSTDWATKCVGFPPPQKTEFGPKNGFYARIRPDNKLDIVCMDTHHKRLSESIEDINSKLAHVVTGGINADASVIPSNPIKNNGDLNAVIASLKGTPAPTQDSPVPDKQSRLSKILKFLRLS